GGGVGQYAVAEGAQTPGAGLQQGMHRPAVHRLEDLRIDLAEHAGIGDGNRQYAGGGAQAHGADKQQGPDDFRDAAQENQQRAHRPAQRLAQHAGATAPGGSGQGQGPAGQQPGGNRHHQRQGHAGGSDRPGLQGGSKQQPQAIGSGRRWPDSADAAAQPARAGGSDRQGLQGGIKQQSQEIGGVRWWPESGDEAAHLALAVGSQQHAQIQLGELDARPQQGQGHSGQQQPRQGGGISAVAGQHRG